MPAVQNFAFGGIANPTQRATLRGSDTSYLNQRQAELDAFEAQRQAYNTELDRYQNEVYNPYKSQSEAYNTAAQQYNTEVYNPYKTQYDAYTKAVEDYNAGPRTENYAGPAEPTLSRTFDMTAPTAPGSFSMTAPALPFDEQEVVARQQAAAGRARTDAASRAAAIDVVSDPDRFNFGSMSVSNRFMAEGGEVTDDLPDRTARAIVKDFEGYGYTQEEIMGLADKVAAAGRGGDELLAYLSPESVRFLKENGGSGTINPITGLSEFKFVNDILTKIGNAFNPSSGSGSGAESASGSSDAAIETWRGEDAPPDGQGWTRTRVGRDDYRYTRPTPAPAPAPAPTPAPAPAPAPEPAKPRASLPSTIGADNPYYESPEYRAYVKANTGMGGMIGTADMYDSPYFGTVGSGSLGKQNDRAYESYLGRLAQEADAAARAQAERDAAAERDRMIALPVIGTPAPPSARDQLEQMPAPPTAPPPYTESPPTAPPQLTPVAPPPLPTPTPPPPRDRIGIPGLIGGAAGNIQVQNPNVPFSPVSAAAALAQLDLSGRVMSPLARNPGTDSASGTKPRGQDASADNIPTYSVDAPNYISRGVGAIGDIGSIPIYTPPTGPMFGNPNRRTGGAATNPSSYFALTPQTSTGLAPGSMAIGSPDMPMYGAVNTMNAIGSNPNLSPTMLGGAQNAGFFTDRMGNRITAPGMAPISRLYGFAKGGEVSGNFGFRPPSNSVNSMETVTWYNPKTGQTYVASSGGYTPPSSDWVVRGAENRGGGSRQTAPEGAPGEGFNPSPGFARSMLDAGKALSNYPVMAPFGMPLKAIGSLANTYGSYLSTVAERNATAKNVEAGAPSGSLQAQPSRVLRQLRSNEAYGPGPDGPDGPGNDGRGGIRGVSGVTAGVGERGRGGMGAEGGSNPGDPGRGGGGAHLAKGGEVDLQALLAQNAETLSDEQPEETINTNPVGTAQQMLADLSGANKPSPTRQSIKRTKTSSGGGADADKAMQMAYEDLAKGDLGAMKDRAPAARNTESARSQMEELARIYQLKIRAAQEQAKGLSADTFGAPTLEGPTLTKNRLTKNRFKDGGEAKKSDVVGDIGKWLKNNDINPSDFLTALGRVGTVAGAALTPSKLNEGEDAELARRRAVGRAEGSPEEGEESLDKFYVPKARPSTGLNRKKGPVSQAIDSGDAYINMAKGATELPYDILGAPVDVATMLMRPFGYTAEKPIMGSDFIKEKMTQAGIRQAPPADPTAKGFYTAGELLSNLTNPAGVTRAAVKGAEKTGKAATAVAKDFQEYNRQLDVPGASYAVRPTGSTMLTGPVGTEENVSRIDRILRDGMVNATSAAGQNQGQAGILQDFWDKKARNYFTRQFGTPDDPVAKGIANKQIKGAALEEAFPEYMIDQIAIGKKRVREGDKPENFVGPGAPDSRIFPKYPRAMDDFTTAYDKATNLKGTVITSDPTAVHPDHPTLLSPKGKQLGRTAQIAEEDKMSMQGLRPEMINANVGTVAYSPNAAGGATADQSLSSSKALLDAYRTASAQKPSLVDRFFGRNNQKTANNILSENVITAIDKGEPVYDINYGIGQPLQAVFDPASINKYLASIPPREAANIRFEDAVAGGLKMREQADQRRVMIDRIASGKPVADSVFSEGVSAPLLQFEEGPSKGFSWKRIEKREATIPEGAYIGHSVGGFEMGGPGYPTTKREAFNTGKYEVYTLRDNRNRPVTTIEVTMMDEVTPVVTQIKGNGRATGNVPAATHEGAVLRFLEEYLRPAEIAEKDELLTPALQKYKRILRPDTPDTPNTLDGIDFI